MAETEDEGLLTQADLEALVAAATQDGPADQNGLQDGLQGGPGDEAVFGYGLTLDSGPADSPFGGEAFGGTSPSGMVDLPSFGPAASFEAAPALEMSGGLGRVRDIPLDVAVELGRTRLLIRDILDLSPGSIIELDKLAGEPVDLFANGLLVARGEVIVIDDNFGVRVTEIITAAERKGGEDTHALAA